eukprot:CAMPEP_0119157522 /NCGR_PEP_ID=MMETSP1310-20130426/52796_1 /TAXON_ID=464262 /ORGANISM="Genus nov. species nov., Strain RCC2339" /LENGTH=336 /DNA_ID=CAMNT_0007150141 /DNA_START=132 /DNA_END=1142 /DNA_ORIENTATION=-
MSALDQFKEFTTVVADTGDFGEIEKYQPQDSTTNPSLVYAASQMKRYEHLVDEAIAHAKEKHGADAAKEKLVESTMDALCVFLGCEILKKVPGRVSTEIDARLSFDTEATVKKGRELMALYKARGVDKDRVLLKIASTWEGLQAGKILEAEGYHCNLTLLFSMVQAHVAGEAGVTLISPFAGRITDFYKAKDGRTENYPVDEDPGVMSVRNIYNYMKSNGYKTVVMGASFRTADQVLALAGCDLVTVSPKLLDQLKASDTKVTRVLDEPESFSDETSSRKRKASGMLSLSPSQPADEKTFRWLMNEDEMASFKLAEGIRKFTVDIRKLETAINQKL